MSKVYGLQLNRFDFFLFLFRLLVEFNEFYRIRKLSMDSKWQNIHGYHTVFMDNVHYWWIMVTNIHG